MTPAEVRKLPSKQLVGMLTNLRPSDEAVAFLAAIVADAAAVESVCELRRRFAGGDDGFVPRTAKGRISSASTIHISGDRFRHFLWRRRMTLSQVGGLIDRSDGWGHVMASRQKMGLYAADELACALGLTLEMLIAEIGSDAELERL